MGKKLRLLDLCCKAGGASVGYHNAGFEVVGVDIEPQPNYPFEFYQADALKFDLRGFDVIHASPPCQAYTRARTIQQRTHPKLIKRLRKRLAGYPYVIENVVGAPLENPILLCGTMFGIRTYRHRIFEASFPLVVPSHPEHKCKQVKMGRPVQRGDFIQIVGHFSNVDYAKKVMEINWMNRNELAEAIPPVYSEYIGHQMMQLFQKAA